MARDEVVGEVHARDRGGEVGGTRNAGGGRRGERESIEREPVVGGAERADLETAVLDRVVAVDGDEPPSG